MVRTLTILFLASCVGVAQGRDNPQDAMALKRIEDAKRGFSKAEETHSKALIAKFDSVERLLRKKKELSEEKRQQRLAIISSEREAFVSKQTLPASDEMLEPLVEYATAVHKSRRELIKAYKVAISHFTKSNDRGTVQFLNAEKAKLDDELPGRREFRNATQWTGVRHNLRNNVEWSLTLTKVDGNLFDGIVDQSRGHAVMDVTGQIEGNEIQFYSTRMWHGANRKLAFSGFILGDRLVIRVGGIAVGGGPADGLVMLHKK